MTKAEDKPDGIAEAREAPDGTWSVLANFGLFEPVHTVTGLPSKEIAERLAELIGDAFMAGGDAVLEDYRYD